MTTSELHKSQAIRELQVLIDWHEEQDALSAAMIVSYANEISRLHEERKRFERDLDGMHAANEELWRKMCDANLRVAQLEWELREVRG